MHEVMINHFTHTDLDGVGCAVLTHLFAKQNDAGIVVEYCDRGKNMNINDRVNRLLDTIDMVKSTRISLPEKRYIIISDISIDDKTAARLNSYRSEDIDILMVDHHPPEKFVDLCPWAKVDVSPDTCSTELLYDRLQYYFYQHRLMGNWAQDVFVEDVRKYDTWTFQEGDNAYLLNVLLGCMSQDAFQSIVTSWLIERKAFIVPYTPYAEIVEHVSKERKAYCRRKLSSVQRISWRGYLIGVVFGEKCISQLADTILDSYPDIDICAVIVMPGSVSLRTRRSDICLGEIAAHMGGGGHQKAAAYLINKPNEDMIRKIMKLQEESSVGEETKREL